MELKRTELAVRRERAVLVSVLLPGLGRNRRDPLSELYGLSTTAGARVVGTLTQRRRRPDSSAYLGRGKLDELASLVREAKADVVILDNELTPAQTRNLELATDTKVLDRTELILHIFASRARTHEARLQVELAQLEYALPRLKRMWTHLSRIEGGIGMRGPGEKQLEEDRRIVDRRIAELRSKLKQVAARKKREVASRSNQLTVALVGYTNAGKSTLMNLLTKAGVRVEDKLFATLDTRTRRWPIPGLGTVLLSDTVGFIKDLPHKLVASFRATLEEVREANLLLHVVDASSEVAKEQISAVDSVLQELDCGLMPTIVVLNKVDQISDRFSMDVLRASYPDAVSVSARHGDGVDQLQRKVIRALSLDLEDIEIETSAGNGKLLAYLDAHAIEESRRYEDARVIIRCRLQRERMGQIARLYPRE